MEAVLNNLPLYCAMVGVVGVIFAIILAVSVKSAPAGDEKCRRLPELLRKAPLPI